MTLRTRLAHAGERRLIWLEGEEPACIEQAISELAGTIFWLGDGPTEFAPMPPAKGLQRLGQECDTLVFNAFSGFHADAFGALAGTLRAGGLLLLLTPPRAQWPAFADPDRLRLLSDPADLPRCGQGFLRRVVRLLADDPALRRECDNQTHWQPLGPERPCTQGQAEAIAAIAHVLHGHRKRPLLISADRGRGKSSALGLAARALLDTQPDLRIGITAPARATVAPLLRHAGDDPRLLFFSPDRLLDERPPLDLLLIDEAAAIPTPLLEGLLGHYHRLVFATTEHGYEGTGRGFHLRFKRHLDRRTPGWRELHLDEPIRWSQSDPLEPLLNRLLALAANAPPPETNAAPQWRQIGADQVADDEGLLLRLFGLLVLAHYQTTPGDLRTLLESPDLDIHLLEADQQLLGVALVAREGPIAPDLAQQIWAGRRRPRGQLLPQSLLAHGGLKHAGERRYARVMRIAIHPTCHRRGHGHALLAALTTHYTQAGFDYLGSAFSAGEDLLPFWRRAGFAAVRLGLQRDAASGSHAVLMLRPLRPALADELAQWQQRFMLTLPPLLAGELCQLSPLVLRLCLAETPPTPPLAPWEWDELDCFAHHHKPFELCQGVLQRWLLGQGAALIEATAAQAELAIGAIWQNRPWERLDAGGKPAAIRRLRQWVAARLAPP